MPESETQQVPFFILEQQRKQKPATKTNWAKLFRLFILPIVTLVVFVGVLVTLTLPKLGDIFANLDAIGISLEQVKKLDQELIDLNTLRQSASQTTSDLTALNTSVPTGNSQVADFQSRVLGIAQQNTLDVSDATIGEQILNSNVGNTGPRNNLALVEIPATFTLRGSKTNLVKFIDDVLKLDDFVIIGEMKLTIVDQSTPSGDNWTLKINFLKYQFPIPDDENKLIAVYSNVPATADTDATVLELIRN